MGDMGNGLTASPLTGSAYSGNVVRPSLDVRTIERDLQNVFTTVLKQVGQEGYVSAKPIETDASMEVGISKGWDEWFGAVASTRYNAKAGYESPSVRAGKTLEDLHSDFGDILLRAYDEGGYASPETFLKALTKDELAAVQQVQHLANPIRVEGLSREAALNLLLPPATQVDLNDDGITSVGAASMLRFPDSRTPAIVRDAWEATTAGMSVSDRMIYELKLTRVNFMGNDSSAPKPDATDVESFVAKANDWLGYLENFKNQIPLEQYVQDKDFWMTFRSNITIAKTLATSLNE